MSSECEFEPIPGLPAHLPEGENLLWQCSPATGPVFRQVLHGKLVAVYFAVLLGWRWISGLYDGEAPGEIMVNSIPLLVTAAAALGLLWLIARLIARTTIYSITSRRVVMRFGIALPMTVNIPYSSVKSANVLSRADLSGDIALTVEGLGRLSYVHLWPHVRGWHVRAPQPALRALPNVTEVSSILSKALHEAAGQKERPVAVPVANMQSRQRAAGMAASAPA